MRGIKTVLRVVVSFFILESGFILHEYGHLREFQKRNIPIKEFSLGIGPMIYRHQTENFIFNLRVIPFMAYVAPTEQGAKLFEENISLRGKIAVATAGIRNNLLCGVGIVFLLQILGWMKGNLSLQELVKMAAITPFKSILLFFSFLVTCVTFGYIDVTRKFLLSTGGIDPPKPLKFLIVWNMLLGFYNLMPIPMLDGGHTAQAVLLLFGMDIRMLHIPNAVGSFVFVVFLMSICSQSLYVLEIDSLEECENLRAMARKRRDSRLGKKVKEKPPDQESLHEWRYP